MKRQVDMKEISDGKRYSRNDMVRLGCQDCAGCSACCHDMESTILDPWDIWMLTTHLQCSFEQLLERYVRLQVVDGLSLPQLKMDGENNSCLFLDKEGRCSIHSARPGVCRLFPLGRIYEKDGFSYFLQKDECKIQQRSKVKIEKWLGIQELSKYERYILKWHGLLKELEAGLDGLDGTQVRTLHLLVLRVFFMTKYEEPDFYGQFDRRHAQIVEMLGL